jgi:acyl carrier protein
MSDSNLRLKNLLEKVLKVNLNLKNWQELSFGDVDEWDSLGNFALLLAIESEFSVEFSTEELMEIKSVKQILDFLNKY